MNHRSVSRIVGFMAGLGMIAASILVRAAEPTDADPLGYLVKDRLDQAVWPSHTWIEENFGQPEDKTAEQIDQDTAVLALQRTFWERAFEQNIAEAKKLAKDPDYRNPSVLRAIQLYRLNAERNAEMDKVHRLKNRDQEAEVGLRYYKQELELLQEPLKGENPGTREIARLEKGFRKETKYLDGINQHMEEVRRQKLREEADRDFQVWASTKDVQLLAGQAGSVNIAAYGGIPPYRVLVTTSENEQLIDGSVSTNGGSLSVPLRFPSGGNRSVFVVVEDSGPPGQQKHGGVTVIVQVGGPENENATLLASGQALAAPTRAPGTPETLPESPPPSSFAPCLTAGTYRAYFNPGAWPPGWTATGAYRLTAEAKLNPEYEFLPEYMEASVTIKPDGRLSGETQAEISDADFEHDSREWVAKGETYSWTYSYQFDGQVDFESGRTEIQVTHGRHELIKRNLDPEDKTTKQRREFRFDATLRGWMVPGPADARQIPKFYAALLGLPKGKARQDLSALPDSTPTAAEDEIINLVSNGAWPRLRREPDGRVVIADCGFIGATVPGDASAVSVKYETAIEEDIGSGGARQTSTRKTAPKKGIRDETAEQQQEIDQRAAAGQLAWSLRLIGPAPTPARPASAASTPEAELVAFGIWPSAEPIQVTLDRAGQTIQLDAIGAMSGHTVEIKNLSRQCQWKPGEGLTDLGQGRLRIDSPGLHRVRVEMAGPDGYRWTATQDILVTQAASVPAIPKQIVPPPDVPPSPALVPSFSGAAKAGISRHLPAAEAVAAPQALFIQAQEAVTARQFDEAERLVRLALAQEPKDAGGVGYNYLGTILFNAARFADAERAFRQAIARRPKADILWFNLGNTLAAQNKMAATETAYRKAARLAPDNSEYQYQLGTALVHQRKYAEAERMYRAAVALDPGSALSYNGLGSALQNQGTYGPAETAFREAIRLDPKLATAHANLAGALWAQNRIEEAVAAARQAMELGQRRHWVYEELRLTPPPQKK